jgi:hypothetical protein
LLIDNKPKQFLKHLNIINYTNLKERLNSTDWSLVFDADDSTSSWNYFNGLLSSAVSQETITKVVTVNPSHPWISLDLRRRAKMKKKLWMKFKSSNSPVDYHNHRKFSNKLSCDLKKAKCLYENRILNSNNKSVYKYIRQKISSTVSTPRVQKSDGSLSESDLETANILSNFFESVFVKESPSLPHTIHRPYVQDSLETVILNENLLLEEMYRINVNSAPGPDNITAKTLKFCADALVQPLLHIFKLSFQSSSLPSGWLKALVTPIYKKGDKTLASNYRPISLTSICCKLMERIISKQLTEFALNNNVIPKEQHGFLPGRSVFTCHLHCLNKWASDLNNSRPVDVVYLDFEKAFDRVPHRRLLLELQHFGVRGLMLRWIQAFLSNRTFSVKVRHSKSYDCTMASGVPQGSVLGPLLFVIYISDLNSIIDVDHVFFADDGKLYGNPSSQFQSIQDSLVISHWCRDWLIQLNIEKCEVLHLGKNNPHPAYVINNKNLKEVESHNDLGVIVNQNLSWSDHVCFITKRANRSSYLMFKVFRRLDFETFKKLYKVYIRPLLEYANLIWSPHLQRDIDTLERIQRRATKRVAGLRSIPYATRLQM